MTDRAGSSPRLVALRELATEADLERRDFLYEATEQLRRFLDANRERLREVGPIKLVDDARFRIRVGDVRIVYSFDATLVTIVAIERRDQAYDRIRRIRH